MTTLAVGFSGADTRERKRALLDAVGRLLTLIDGLVSALRAGQPSSVIGPGAAWTRPGQSVTFRAEVMPGRERAQRTFLVCEALASGRVLLEGIKGEHSRPEFESCESQP